MPRIPQHKDYEANIPIARSPRASSGQATLTRKPCTHHSHNSTSECRLSTLQRRKTKDKEIKAERTQATSTQQPDGR